MTIEGNWLTGAMTGDYPDVSHVVVELPASHAGKGTVQYTNGYGIAEASSRKDDAVALVEFLTSTDQQLAFSQAFGVATRTNMRYVLLVVPTQTSLSLFLALLVNQTIMARGVFRTALYFPSATRSVAVTVLWLFLFSVSGAVNKVLSLFGIDGSGNLAGQFLGVTVWEWLCGPSFAMTAFIVMAVVATSGTFMLILLSALQPLSSSVDEAAALDGAGTWRVLFSIVLPMSVPALVTITILSFQGSWNELSHFIVASRSPELVTLTRGVSQLSASSLGQGNRHPLKLGAALIMTIPVAVLFFVFQRRIMDTSSGAAAGTCRPTPRCP